MAQVCSACSLSMTNHQSCVNVTAGQFCTNILRCMGHKYILSYYTWQTLMYSVRLCMKGASHCLEVEHLCSLKMSRHESSYLMGAHT